MARKTTVIGFSVSPEMAEEYQKLTEQEKTTKSELLRRMIECYKADRGEEEFFKLQRKMARQSGKDGMLSEKEVERIVFEAR